MATSSFSRTSIEDFIFANNAYILASVTFYAPDASGNLTTVKIPLYSDVTGPVALPNPQQLDDEGKFEQPVYFQDPWIAVVNLGPTSHQTGVVVPPLSDVGTVSVDADTAAQAASDAAAYMVMAQQAAISFAGRDNVNPIVNPDCAVAQIGTLITAINDNAYAGDGLRVLSEANGDCNWSRVNTDTPVGSATIFDDSLAVVNTNKKFGFFRPIESNDTIRQRATGQTLIFSFLAVANASIKMRAAILAWDGTADAITADPISVWGADGTNPTLAAGWAYCNTPVDLGVSGVLSQFNVIGVVPASTDNLAVFVWNDSKTTTSTHVLRVGNYDLRRGNVLLPFEPVPIQQNLARCQRYAPVFDSAAGTGDVVGVGLIQNATSNSRINFKHPVHARLPITGVTVSNPTNFVLSNLAIDTAVSAIAFAIGGISSTTLQATTAALVAGQACYLRGNNVNCRIEFTGARL